MIPWLNASRSPRVCSWRGSRSSRARIEPSTGAPLNAGLAASTRMSPVVAAATERPGGQRGAPGEDRAGPGGAVERGVGGQHEDEPGRGGDDVEAEREAAEERLGDL